MSRADAKFSRVAIFPGYVNAKKVRTRARAGCDASSDGGGLPLRILVPCYLREGCCGLNSLPICVIRAIGAIALYYI
jgi:hypothetical protein